MKIKIVYLGSHTTDSIVGAGPGLTHCGAAAVFLLKLGDVGSCVPGRLCGPFKAPNCLSLAPSGEPKQKIMQFKLSKRGCRCYILCRIALQTVGIYSFYLYLEISLTSVQKMFKMANGYWCN